MSMERVHRIQSMTMDSIPFSSNLNIIEIPELKGIETAIEEIGNMSGTNTFSFIIDIHQQQQ